MRLLLLDAPCCSPCPPPRRSRPARRRSRIYRGLHAAAAKGDAAEIARLIAAGEKVDASDGHRRTPLHVAAHFGHQAAAQALSSGGANPNALDAQQYDIVTIAAVTNDVPMLKLALAGGCNPKNITSPYQGTALIAAAHLGHAEVVRVLIAAGAPLDHVNNLGWTALIESIVLGNGGKQSHRHARRAGEGRRERQSRGPRWRDAARAREGARLRRDGADPGGGGGEVVSAGSRGAARPRPRSGCRRRRDRRSAARGPIRRP